MGTSYNEHLRLSERYLRFDADELCRIIANALGQGFDDVKTLIKLAEGGYYRVFEAVFQNGQRAIARLPYPFTLPRKYGVASEVATMEFMRLYGVPTPRIYAWSDTSVNSLGSEYMIMEKCPGKELESTWFTMSMKERFYLMQEIVKLEHTLFSIHLPANGSLYFRSSLEDSVDRVDVETSTETPQKFCIGPSVQEIWWYKERDGLRSYNGPWRTSTAVLEAVGKRELAWMNKFAKPRWPRELAYRHLYNNQLADPEIQKSVILDYLKVAPLLSPSNTELCRPCIRHPDLSPNNIFISDSGQITGLIDWQHTVVLPLFLQALIPQHFQNYGDADSENFVRPKLPDDLNSFGEKEKEAALELYRRRQVHYFYLGATSKDNPDHFKAMETHDLIMRHRLYDTAARPWDGDNTSLKAELIRVLQLSNKDAQPSLLEPKSAVQYPEAEVEKCLSLDEEQRKANTAMQRIRNAIGINIDGLTPIDNYEEALMRAQYFKDLTLEKCETDEEREEILQYWPYQDHEEVD